MDALDLKRKKLLYQSQHRGTKENDLILARFAEHRLHTLSSGELDLYESLLSEYDGELYHWFTAGEKSYPEKYKNLLIQIMHAQESRHATN